VVNIVKERHADNTSQSTAQDGTSQPPTVTRFYFVREHHLHGIVTGIEGVKTMASAEDNLDRLLVSFKDAKVSTEMFASYLHNLIFPVQLR